LRQAVPQLTRGITISVGVGGAVVVVTTKNLDLTTIMTTDSPLATTYSAIMPWLTRLMQVVAATLRQAVPQLTRGITISVGVGGAVVVVTTMMTTNRTLATTYSAMVPWLTRLMQMVAATLRLAVPQLTRGVTISVGVGVSQTGGKSGDTG